MGTKKADSSRISIGTDIAKMFPTLAIGWLEATIVNTQDNPELWNLILERSSEIEATLDEEGIRQVDGISAGKRAYRQLGKDPNRYRLSAESLMRRATKGKELYRISPAVDALNLVSLRTGITIGGFDSDKLSGEIELGIGLPGEEFTAIGRGPLNVEKLPVYRDRSGAIGNPTSDSERTRITQSTTKVLMLITGFYGIAGIEEVLSQLQELLALYCSGCEFGTGICVNI